MPVERVRVPESIEFRIGQVIDLFATDVFPVFADNNLPVCRQIADHLRQHIDDQLKIRCCIPRVDAERLEDATIIDDRFVFGLVAIVNLLQILKEQPEAGVISPTDGQEIGNVLVGPDYRRFVNHEQGVGRHQVFARCYCTHQQGEPLHKQPGMTA